MFHVISLMGKLPYCPQSSSLLQKTIADPFALLAILAIYLGTNDNYGKAEIIRQDI